MNKKLYLQAKPGGGNMYTWTPQNSDKKLNKQTRPYFCNATAGSRGEDWISTYSIENVIIDNGQLIKIAYVECGYVE